EVTSEPTEIVTSEKIEAIKMPTEISAEFDTVNKPKKVKRTKSKPEIQEKSDFKEQADDKVEQARTDFTIDETIKLAKPTEPVDSVAETIKLTKPIESIDSVEETIK